MKKPNLLIPFFIGLLILSCSSKEDEFNRSGSIVGVYNLVSIESKSALDPDVTTEFNDTEIIDNISCTSTMTLDSSGLITWDYLNLVQALDLSSEPISYSEIECQKVNGGSGLYEIAHEGITFNFDPTINVTSAVLTGDFIKVRMNVNLVTNVSGTIQKEPVELKFIYKD